ncbi:hypothetical protein V6N11_081727 [Hibiscus sabdariffa]|uniref:Uncharacterized protein n=1 Tax=Hibiscus sabdariffa TaxID=183260 RepID=A0ABR2Q7E5_9ROSI
MLTARRHNRTGFGNGPKLSHNLNGVSLSLVEQGQTPASRTPFPHIEPQYSIVVDRPRRDMRSPKRYRKDDLMAYELDASEDIDASQEPSTHFEVVGGEDSK